MEKRDLLIIGGGSAGMAAAIAAYDDGIKDVLIVERTMRLGGIINQCIHAGFGLHEFGEELTGPEFLTRFAREVQKRGIQTALGAKVISLSKDKIVRYVDKSGLHVVKCKAVITAVGCYERNAGAIGIPGSRPSGVLTAGQAQAFLNEYGYITGKRVFILGSGDIGLIMARRMTLEGAKVLGVAEIMPYSNGLNRNIVQCLEDFGIPLFLSHTVSKVIGGKKIEAIEISQVDDKLKIIPGTEKRFEVDNLLLSVGLVPDSKILSEAGVKLSPNKGPLVDDSLMTDIEGVYCCGNALHVHDLVDYVVKEGRDAGHNAANYIKGESLPKESNQVLPGDGVGYVVPSFASLSGGKRIDFKFRVRKPQKDVYILYSQNGQIVKKSFKPILIPSEMVLESIDSSLFNKDNGPITVSVAAKEDIK